MVLADIGSGTGEMIKLLSGRAIFRKFLAVEPCASMLDHVENDYSTPIEKLCLDGETFSQLENIRYDTSIMFSVIHHFQESVLPKFLRGVYSQTNPGGTVLVTTRDPPCAPVSTNSSTLPWPVWPDLINVFAENDPSWDLQETMRQAGFNDVTCVKRSYGDVVIPRDMWLHMLRNRFLSIMAKLSDEEIEDGISQMDYPDPVVFEDWKYFVKGRKTYA
jgi:cyclopropane fatty-acyl-phospholipid synthase-like methyltransferase